MASPFSSNLSHDITGKKKGLLLRSDAMCGDDDTKLKSNDKSIKGFTEPYKFNRTFTSLSKESSRTDYTDSTGIDLFNFIVNTLHKNLKDREMLLNLEFEMRKFVADNNRQAYKFPKMSSYNRMLVHRVAAFFGLDHNIDQSGTLVVVNKTSNTKMPGVEFPKLIKNDNFSDQTLTNRNVQSFDECCLNNDVYGNFNSITTPNFGSNSTIPVGMPAPFSSTLEMVRRPHSFEVGEWNNNMAVGNLSSKKVLPTVPSTATLSTNLYNSRCGASSSNSSSSWQLAGSNIQYSTSRPESIVSPISCSGIVDPSSVYFNSGQSSIKYPNIVQYSPQLNDLALSSSYLPNTSPTVNEQKGQINVNLNEESIKNNMHLIYPQNVLPNLSVANMNQPMGVQTLDIIPSQQISLLNENQCQPVNNIQSYSPNYQQQLITNPLQEYITFTGNPVMPQQPIQYYIAQYPVENLYNYPISPDQQQQQQLADYFQGSMRISSNTNKDNQPYNLNIKENAATLNNANSSLQLVPINTPNGICFMTVPGSSFDIGTVARVPYVVAPTQRVMIPYDLQMPIYVPNVENVEKAQLSTNQVDLSSSLETEHTLKNINS